MLRQMSRQVLVRCGVFVALLAGVIVVLALAMPLPYGPPLVLSGQPHAIAGTVRCVQLRFERGEESRYYPWLIRLRSDTMFRRTSWLQADGLGQSAHAIPAWWRPVGTDSLDIAWHHSPIVRLPWQIGTADSSIGRVIPAGV